MPRRLARTLAGAALALGLCSSFAPSQASAPASAESVVRALLDSLGARASEARFAFDVPERRVWRRDPSPRPGVALMDLSAEQRERVRALLATVLSERGLATVDGIRSEQNLLGLGEEGLGDGHYWLAIYGEPGQGRWAWRFGGHHVSVHATYDGVELVGLTPVLLGGEQEDEPAERWEGYRRLQPREQLARELVAACSEAEWTRACLGERALGALELSEPTMKPLTDADEGLSLATMAPGARAKLRELIAEYVAPLGTPLGIPSWAQLEAEAERVTFGWAGSRDAGAAHSYRIRAPGLLIEYVNSGSHLHALLRTRSDWGEDR